MTKIQSLSLFGILGVAIILLVAIYLKPTQSLVVGSNVVGNDYVSTTTSGSFLFGGNTGGGVIRGTYGTLSAVVITGANTGVFNLYDATTTNVNLRTGNKASSTILIASFPASATAGDYVFDAVFNAGLYLDVISGPLPTSTIIYR